MKKCLLDILKTHYLKIGILVILLAITALAILSISNCSAAMLTNADNAQTASYKDSPAQSTQQYSSKAAENQKLVSEVLKNLPNSENIKTFGSVQANPTSYDKLITSLEYLNSLQEKNVSFVMIDINTLSGVTYNAKKPMYAKSCIKAPYIISLLEGRPEVYSQNLDKIKHVLAESNNEDYEYLRDTYGKDFLFKWCCEEDLSLSCANTDYPTDTTVIDLAILWSRIYTNYCSSSTIKEVYNFMEGSKMSAISETLGNRYKVLSKAGWELAKESSTGKGLSFTNDAGIVIDKNDPYILAVMSEIPASTNDLKPIIDTLNLIHMDIVNAK